MPKKKKTMLKIRLVKSRTGRKPKHMATIKALGLRRINSVTMKEDTPVIRGMIKKVDYLVEVTKEEV